MNNEWNPLPLHTAARVANVTAAQAFLNHGADVNLRDNACEQTPLEFAIESGEPSMVSFLVASGAQVNKVEMLARIDRRLFPGLCKTDTQIEGMIEKMKQVLEQK